ncbi:MAG: hypothetical protein JO131_04045, partial [Gammaproteobacteria bacterium]|nr:hypothetical protein [Gammaproteobacteria bacterium]
QPKPIEPQGYIYVFDYKGCEAFDIDQTNIARNKIQFKKIDEVNIKGHIPSYCIRGAWKIKRNEPHAKTWIENSNYNLTKANTLTPPKNSSFIQSTLFYSKETLGLLPTIEKTLVQSTSLTNKK